MKMLANMNYPLKLVVCSLIAPALSMIMIFRSSSRVMQAMVIFMFLFMLGNFLVFKLCVGGSKPDKKSHTAY